MRNFGQCYVQAFNKRHRRSGTLWQGRFKSCLVDAERYLLTVYRYIELNPVRASMVSLPEHYRWSSMHANLGMIKDPLGTPHSTVLAQDIDPEIRTHAYRFWLREGVGDHELDNIRAHLQQERALGDIKFQVMVGKSARPPGSAAESRPTTNPGRPTGRGLIPSVPFWART